VREIFTLIDWMMHLRDDLAERFKIELEQFEEERKMPYVTSVERIAKAEGKAEGEAKGKAEGAAEVILAVLRRGCGRLPKKLQDRIHGLPLEDLEKVQRRMFEFEKAGDVTDWLDAKGL